MISEDITKIIYKGRREIVASLEIMGKGAVYITCPTHHPDPYGR